MTGNAVALRLVAPSKVAYKPAEAGITGDPWDSYWANSKRVGEVGVGGPKDEALQQFWSAFFVALLSAGASQPRILDLGSGDGAVAGFALEAAASESHAIEVHCLDLSPAALSLVKRQFPAIVPLCASAADIPTANGRFHAVVSQFGMEYAGIDAVAETARVLSPGGRFAAVLHQRGGAIFEECQAIAEALQATQDSGVLDAFSTFLKSACALRDGHGTQAEFAAADKALAPCVQALEAVLRRVGREGAGGMIFGIYSDIAHMYQRPYNYSADDVAQWAHRVEGELLAFEHRMRAMTDAALDEAGLNNWRRELDLAGVELAPSATLAMGPQQRSAAWILQGVRRSD